MIKDTQTLVRKRGFTLIELSIVLVIISLIVAGIVGGRSLVRSAELRDVISGLLEYETAINGFELQYNALPGDIRNAQSYWSACTNLSGNRCNGDGDGLIDFNDSPALEHIRVWHHLRLADVVGGPYDGVATSPLEPGRSVGLGSTNETLFDIVAPGTATSATAEVPATIFGLTSNMVHFRSISGVTNSLTSREARNIDRKIDNGQPDDGRLLAWRLATDEGCIDNDTPTVGSSYSLADLTPSCILSYVLN